MADPVIGAAIQVTLETALSLASDRIGMLVGFKKDVASMTRSLRLIKGVLADAEAKQNQNEAVQEWLKSLEEVAYDAQNVLDELHYESLRHQVRDINLELNKINEEANRLELVSRLVMTAALPAAVGDTRSRQTDSVVAPMIGRVDDESNILEMLLRPSEKVVSVLPIIGMGGLGKTTLAKSIYNKKQIDALFDKKIWVCVSKKDEVGDRQNIVQEVGKELGKLDEVGDRQNIVQEVGKKLGKSRYLLVLDDVWDNNHALWDDFFATLKGLNPINPPKGSWCLITTRLHRVAGNGYPLGRLPDDHCWSIIKGKVVEGEEVPNELDKIEDAIKDRAIQICNGLPLVASVLGYLKNRTMENKTMEEIGEYYLEILLQSSLLEEIRDGWRRCYKMHDMVHDVSKSIMSKSTKFINSETGSGDNSNQVCCLVIDSFGEGTKNLFESRSNLLHTLFLSRGSLSDDMLMKLKNLHVLNLSGEENQNLPISIGKLIHLRYINFEDSTSETLPESVCKLYNLQTLRLSDSAVKHLPKGTCDLISLRHLHYDPWDENFQMPLEMGRLTCLQTLKFFNVGRKKGRRIGELGSLKNLKGKLEIRNLELVKDRKEAEEAKLFEKANLFRLELWWACNREGGDYNDKDVLDGLRPHPNLEELVIWYFMGDQFPRWLMDLPTTLPKLARLEFTYCHRCRELLPLQNFASLKELTIWRSLKLVPSQMMVVIVKILQFTMSLIGLD
ncbi:unnamed protein product [Coffea canephora]|uniref:Disease resistance protein RGA3 n=1 Tax=Coffea canephora TaxID=49390 RepID=A0A068V8F5_COFCA|nr:unnamed protein product [Coffea canephora]